MSIPDCGHEDCRRTNAAGCMHPFSELKKQPFQCPVCNGVGHVSAGFYLRDGNCLGWTSSSTQPDTCRSCGGTGIVWG